MNPRPIVATLLRTLQDHNFTLVSVDDDRQEHTLTGTPRTRRQAAKSIICSNTVTDLYLLHPSYPRHLMVTFNSSEVIDHTEWPVLNLALQQYERKTKI
jgi:hypothetical protein